LTYDGTVSPVGFDALSIEQSLVAGVARRIGNRVAVAIVVRGFLQSLEEAQSITQTQTYRDNQLILTTAEPDSSFRNKFGATGGVSVTYEPVPRLRLAASGLDLVSTQEHFGEGAGHNPSLGLGAAVYLGRVHLGADVLAQHMYGVDAAVGASIRATEWLDVTAGAITLERSVRLSVRLFGLMIAPRYAFLPTRHLELGVGGSWSF
jgi:hypothetical protein